MVNHRHATIPHDHIVSNLITFPLASVSAFENSIVELDPLIKESTEKLWRNVERKLIHSVPDLTIDQVVAVRDLFWFHNSEKPVSMADYLLFVSSRFLRATGPVAVSRNVRYEENREHQNSIMGQNRNKASFRWLSYYLPPDLLMGALGNGRRPPAEISHLSPQVRMRLKDHGFAETHLHLWASLEFPTLWITTLHALGDTGLDCEAFQSPGADFNEGRQLAPWLIRAAVARYFLALFLYEKRVSSIKKDMVLSDYFGNRILKKIRELSGPVIEEQVRRALMELVNGRFLRSSPDYPSLRSFYRDISRNAPFPLPDNPAGIHAADPIAHLTPHTSWKGPLPEVFFTNQGIAYLKQSSNEKDTYFNTLFWQTIRLRAIYYLHIVQRPLTPGLQWFIRTYARIKPGRKTANQRFAVRMAARTCGAGKGLRSLEVRKSPDDSSSENLGIVRDFLQGLANDSRIGRGETKNNFEFGVVFHFSKTRGGGSLRGLMTAQWRETEADPEFRGGPFRYSNYYRKRKYDAMALVRMLLNFPQTLKVARGVDVCTDELGVPTWVLAPHLRYVRDAGNEVARYFRCDLGEEVPELKTTVHTGEDFVHLIQGMRHVDQSIRYFDLRPGDRLGHAIALGIDPATWAERVGRVAMPKETRLFDLVWEWGQYSRRGVSWTAERPAFVEREIMRLSEHIFGEICSPYLLEKFIHCLHDENRLKQIGFPDNPVEFAGNRKSMKKAINFLSDYLDDPARFNKSRKTEWIGMMTELSENKDNSLKQAIHLMFDYLTSPAVFKKGREIEWVNAVDEIESMKSLQYHLREAVADLGLVVEVNPSSNLLIGNLADIESHPLWRLNPPNESGDSPPIAVCVGSDDPLTFATNLRREYEILHEALVAGGLSDIQALAWLDRVRETGMCSRFTCLDTSELGRSSDPNDPLCICSLYASDLGRYISPMP